MLCPECRKRGIESPFLVKDSDSKTDASRVYRLRVCRVCGHREVTTEKVEGQVQKKLRLSR